MSSNNIKHKQSVNYFNEGDNHLILTFNSLERGDADDDCVENNSFIYNSQKDMYRINSAKKSKFTERANSNLMKKDEDNLEDESKLTQEDEFYQGNTNFCDINNIINNKEKNIFLLYVIMLSYLLFSVIELIFGYFSKSLILMTYAAYYFTEGICFLLFIIIIVYSQKKEMKNKLINFHKGGLLGSLIKETLLLGFSFWIFYYIIRHLINNELSNGIIIIIIGVINAFFNIIMGLVLIVLDVMNSKSYIEKQKTQNSQPENELNSNKVSIYIKNIIFKSIQSCIIICGGVLIYYFPLDKYIDPICALLLILFLICNSFYHIKGTITKLIESSSVKIDKSELKKDLLNIKSISKVYNIQVRKLNTGKPSLSCNIITNNPNYSYISSKEIIKYKYRIDHITIQMELEENY